MRRHRRTGERLRDRAIGRGLHAAALALSVAAAACAASNGDRLMERRSFAEAEAAYGVELAANPGDRALAEKQRAARLALIREKLTRARAMREEGRPETALAMLDQAVRLESRWAAVLPPDLAQLRDAEIAAAGGVLGTLIQARLDGQQPFGARKRLDSILPRPVHPRLEALRRQAEAAIGAAGRKRCTELGEVHRAEPHLARFLAPYCSSFGVASTPAATPEQRRGLRISGRLENTSDTQHRALEVWLADAFRASPWYAEDAAELTPATVAGSYDASLRRHWVTRHAPYRTVDHAVVRDPAMPWRKARIESESEHLFEYQAEQYDAHYELAATVKLVLGDGLAPLNVEVKQAQNRRAYQHDETFAPAGVRPQRADLPSVSAWLASYLAGKKVAMVRKLRGRWAKAFCSAPQLTLDEAARCALGREWPASVPPVLTAALGPDAELMLDALLPRPTEEEGDAPVGPAKPVRPGKAHDDAEPPPAFEETPRVPSGDVETI